MACLLASVQAGLGQNITHFIRSQSPCASRCLEENIDSPDMSKVGWQGLSDSAGDRAGEEISLWASLNLGKDHGSVGTEGERKWARCRQGPGVTV